MLHHLVLLVLEHLELVLALAEVELLGLAHVCQFFLLLHRLLNLLSLEHLVVLSLVEKILQVLVLGQLMVHLVVLALSPL